MNIEENGDDKINCDDHNIEIEVNKLVENLINKVCIEMTNESNPDVINPVKVLGKRKIKKPSKYLDIQMIQDQYVTRKMKVQKDVEFIENKLGASISDPVTVSL